MTSTAAFYTFSTIAQTLGAVLGIGGAFLALRIQQVLTLVREHSEQILTSVVPIPEKFEWPVRLLKGATSAFIAAFAPAAARVGVDPASSRELHAAVNICVQGRLLRRVKVWFTLALLTGLPTISASLAMLPIAERIAEKTAWVAWLLVSLAALTLLFFAMTALRTLSGRASYRIGPLVQRAVKEAKNAVSAAGR